eukprot:12906191-Alexandrium_andersonii.AAC.1
MQRQGLAQASLGSRWPEGVGECSTHFAGLGRSPAFPGIPLRVVGGPRLILASLHGRAPKVQSAIRPRL